MAQKFLKQFFTASVILLLACVLAVVVFDPFFQYHKPLKGLKAVLTDKEYQCVGSLKTFDYDSVIAGSSVSENYNNGWFDQGFGCKSIKAIRSYGATADLCYLLDIAFEHQDLKYVFYNLDPSALEADPETTYELTGCPMYLYDDNYFNDIYYLLNKDVVLNYIFRQAADPDKTDLATVYQSWWTDEYYNIQWVMHNYEQPERVETETPSAAYLESVERNLDVNICPYIEQNPDTTFYIFFPPYSILYWNDVICENHLEATMAEYQYIADRLLPYENVRVFFFPNQEWIVTDLNNYADYSHYHKDINHYMTQCFADGSCEISSPEEMKQALTDMRLLIEKFDFEELFSIAY